MSNLTNELSIDELEAVSGGTRNLANDPGFHSTIKTSTTVA
jgi:bacteriocin-like protein